MTKLTLEQATRLASAAIAEGHMRGLKPLTVAVLDAGGHLISLHREDGSSNMRPQIAIPKAAGALALGVSSRKIAEMAVDRPSFIASLSNFSDGGIVPAAGGVIVVDGDDRPIGAIGVTGDTSDNDERCALAGLATTKLRAQS